jgi:hypothetical protein
MEIMPSQDLEATVNRVIDSWCIEGPQTPADRMVNGTLRGLRVEMLLALGLPLKR